MPLGLFSQSMWRRRLRTSLSLTSFLVIFFFLRARNFMSELSSTPELTALLTTELAAVLATALPGRESSKRSSSSGRVGALRDAPLVDVPLLRAQGADELLVVRDEDDAALELADGDGQAAQRVAVQEVGRLVQHQQMRVVPHGAGNDHLDLLPAREGADFVVVGDFRVQPQVFKVLGDDGLGLSSR